VLEVELFRATPIRLRAGHHSYRTTLHGLDPTGTLRLVLDRHGRARPLPAGGLLLTTELAEILDVEPGGKVQIEVLGGRRPTRTVRVGGLADEVLGVAAYTSRPQLAGLVGDSHLVSGARLRLDPRQSQRLVAELRAMPAVGGVSLQANVIEAFERLTGGALVAFAAVLVAFAIAMLVGVIFNAARVLWAERERELATLRILGFTRGELAVVLFGELGAQVAMAIPLGWLTGYGLAALVCAGMKSDLVRLPLWVPAPVYWFAAAIAVVTTVTICLLFTRRLSRLDLLSVLKTAVV
jgi:putative ABC transport system permease protein